MKKILVIGAGWEQFSLLDTIRKEGYSIVATHPEIGAEGFTLADHFYVKESTDIAAHVRIAQAHKVVAIVTDNCDYSFYTASVVASRLGLPFAPIESAIFSNDKLAQRECCAAGGILQPLFYKVRTFSDLEIAANKIGFPVILKPVDSRGTFGVTIIQDKEQLCAAFYDALQHSPSHTLICEKFIEGTLITVDGFCFKNGHRSLAVASRKFEKGIKPVTKEIIYPAQFSTEVNEALFENHHRVVEQLGYRFGHTHGEYILTEENEIYLVECTNRGGGVYTSSVIVPMLTEIDLNKILLEQSLGTDTYQAASAGLHMMKHSAMLTFLDFEVGRVIKYINIKQVEKLPFVVRYRSIFGENDMVESIENCASRHSMLVISGASAAETLQNFTTFKENLSVSYHK